VLEDVLRIELISFVPSRNDQWNDANYRAKCRVPIAYGTTLGSSQVTGSTLVAGPLAI